ncbi:glycosyltransferase [Leifsonia sp. YIM 134122]|uniref:Glycosyltransferase n=1 Tax=Leifsonia stereocauli TaxID=3134136 RepID=A0ABU9W7L2_9MICO
MAEAPDRAIVVAVLTYRRPDDLAALLPLLKVEAASVDVEVDVLVVDNDPDASARDLVTGHAGQGVRYVHEPRPGIAAGRNRAIDSAQAAAALVFIDDDERPRTGWLAELLATWARFGSDGVVGRVISEFSEEPDEWIVGGGFFHRPRFATGTRMPVAATNNLLLDLAFVRRSGIRFDEAFGLSGGSDTLFTRSLTAAGGRLVWCDEAVVTDVVPSHRVSRDWVLQRYFRNGNSWARSSVALSRGRAGRFATRVRLMAAGSVRVAGGTGKWAVSRVTRSRARNAAALRTVHRGMGMISGAWGHVYYEYKRPPA